MNKHNQTVRKASLQRKKQIRAWLARGRTGQSIAKQLGISHQRVYQLANGK